MNVQPNMTEHSLPNGLPPQFNKPNLMPSPVPFNGVDSSHSSRTSSPANRLQQIPASQLPPSRTIPASQLPPQGANINQLTQNYAHLSVSQITPVSSPKIHPFSTSTPVLNPVISDVDHKVKENNRLNFNQNREFSPIATNDTANSKVTQFTHSANSHFANVSLNANSNIKSESQFQNVPLGTQRKHSNMATQGESNNLPTNPLSNQHVNNETSSARVAPQEQTDPQKNLVSGFFRQNDGPKMQQSLSQPLLDMPLTATLPNLPVTQSNQQPNPNTPRSLQSFSSTPNLYQNQVPGNNQNLARNLNQPYSGNPQSLFTFNAQNMRPNSSTGVTNVQNTVQRPQNVQPPLSHPPGQQKPVAMPTPQTRNQPMPFVSQQGTARLQNQNNTAVGLQQNQAGFKQNLGPQHFHSQQPQNTVPVIPHSMASAQPNIPPQTTQPFKANLHANRYPTMPTYPNSPKMQNISQPVYQAEAPYQNQVPVQNQQRQTNTYSQNSHSTYNQANVVQGGFSKVWGQENYDLLQCPNILPPTKVEPPRITLGQDFLDAANCSPDIFRCTMTKIPESSSLLQKSRLPLGILIHPFKDLDHLPVIQCSTIVRCRACRTYINPFVFFVDMKRWKCNLCYRVNELPEEFQFDPVSKTYGDPSRRPEIKSSTIEYIAPSEYMLRPPQPAVYLFLLDVSHAAIESGYLHTFCNVLAANLASLPGDARTQVGFIAYNSALHFYSLAEGLSQPHEMTVLDIEDIFLPCPDNLIVNLQERKELVSDLLAQLPTRFNNSYDTGSALGSALQAAHKMIAGTGGRITVFQATLPTIGPGALIVREDPNQRSGAEVHHLNPANDFYKRLALECSGQQIAVDLFVVNSQYVDLATLSGISRFSGGCIHHFPLFKASRILQAESLERTLKRYFTRKIGFEAVMRIRCTRGLSIHTFHGNFFVRSTDLLSLPNVNPEAGFGMQVAIDESLSDLHTVCFQAALLYTSSKGERRIRVHTLCVPIASTLADVVAAADQQCIVGLLAKMAVDRSMQSSLSDAREAFINVAIDILSSYKLSLNLGSGQSGLLAPECLKLLPLYISALLKYIGFRTGASTRLDDRVKAMCDMKSLPVYLLIQKIYPDLYPVHNLEDQNTTLNVDGEAIPQPPHLQLTARSLDSKGAFLMDMGEHMVLLVGPGVSQVFLNEALGVPDYNSISDQMYNLPNLDTPHNQRLNNFINYLNDEKPFVATLQIIRENSPNRNVFIEHLIEDRIETALSYHEFLQHLKTQVK